MLSKYAPPKRSSSGRRTGLRMNLQEQDRLRRQGLGPQGNRNQGLRAVDISAYNTIHEDLPAPHLVGVNCMVYGVWGYNPVNKKMIACENIFMSWAGVLRQALVIQDYIKTKPTILTDVNSSANKERMRDFLGDKALEARTLHDNQQQQLEQIQNQIALEQNE